MARKILIVRVGAMGDVLHALPAAAALRQAHPEDEVGWLVERRWAELLCAQGAAQAGARSAQRPLVDRLHIIDTFAMRAAPLTVATWSAGAKLRSEIREVEYDVALDLQGTMKSAMLAKLAGAKEGVAGYADPRERAARFLYRKKLTRTGRHVIEQNVSAAGEMSGAMPADPAALAMLPHDAAAEGWAAREIARRGLERFAMLNPGAGWGAKRWPAERYAAVARGLEQDGVRSVINIGPSEGELADVVERESGGAAERVQCSIGELIALTRRAAVFVGGDTGPMHLANMLRVPVVAIFGPTDPARNGPFYTPNMVLRSAKSETSYSHRDTRDAGLDSVSAEDVLSAARRLLEKR